MYNGKITFLNFKGIHKLLTKTISDVPESNPSGEDAEQNCRILINPKSFARWFKPWSSHTFSGDGREGECYDNFSFSKWKTTL